METTFQRDLLNINSNKVMNKNITKYFLFFLIAFFAIGFVGSVFYTHIMGNNKSFILNKVKKRFINNQPSWENLFDICKKINANNRHKELNIEYHINRNKIECDDKTVKNGNGEIIDNWNKAYPNLYNLMMNLDIMNVEISDDLFIFTLYGIPGNACSIIFLTSENNLNSLPVNRKWEYKLKDYVFIVR